MRYLIIGGGIAGTSAAEELRKLDPESEITILSEEQHRLYSRVLLPHYIKAKVPRERVFLKKPEWYDEQKIDWLPGVIAESLDVKNKFVAASDGREYEYDKLLLVTGGEVKLVSGDARGVSYFRTLDDADHLLQLMNEYESGRVGIVGGGFIALEYINIFAERKLKADLFLRGETFFGRALDRDSSELIRRKAEADGITVHTKTTVESPEEFALLGVGIGITPDLKWISEAGIEVGEGIKANEYLETNISDVFTAGDVAEFFDVIADRQLIVGNWMSATMQGRTVAKTMFGERTKFELVSSYATNCRGMEVIFIGDTDRAAAERVVVEGSDADGGVVQKFIRGGRMVGATLVNRNSERADLTRLIKEKIPYV